MKRAAVYQYGECLTASVAEAVKSPCLRRRCGSVVFRGGSIIGRGYNSPAGGEACRCLIEKSSYHPKVTDTTCCVHAEQRAVTDALRHRGDAVRGAMLFFCAVGADDIPLSSGEPYCTICSKTIVDVGIARVGLFRDGGWVMYEAEEYNRVSFQYAG